MFPKRSWFVAHFRNTQTPAVLCTNKILPKSVLTKFYPFFYLLCQKANKNNSNKIKILTAPAH